MLEQGRTTTFPGSPNVVADPTLRAVPRLEWVDETGVHAAIIDRRCVLGSAPHCDVVVADHSVSRVHAELTPRDDSLWIRDLNSRNGTHVEGVRIESACLLNGFHLRVGVTDFIVNYAHADKTQVESWPSDHFGPLVGRSSVMRELFASLARLAPLESSIMILGETGTGKELVARAIHDASTRAAGPFIVVDCGTLSESLIESELFGHMKGSFTGAHESRPGAIEAAHGGTVFLDEIGELPIGMQPKLLRVLESLTVRRIGEPKHRSVSVRFVSATHRDLLSMVNRGEFREDLYFRLAVLPVRLPGLRERAEDIELLLNHFSGGAPEWLTARLLRVLKTRPWRGNVRELRNFVERARAVGAAEALSLSNDVGDERESVTRVLRRLPSSHPPPSAPHPSPPSPSADPAPSFEQPFRNFREEWMGYGEKAFLRLLLARHDHSVSSASKEAGIDRTHMYRLIRKHGL